MNTLITGASGQLGKALKEFYPDAIFTTRKELDLLGPNVEAIIREIDPFQIINTAAIVGSVDKADQEPVESILVNAVAVHRMLSAMRNPENFVQVSTDYVVSDNIYGLSKKMAESMVLRNRGTVIRTAWLFGDGNNWVKWTLKNREKPLTIVDDQISRPTYARDLARAIKNRQGRGILEIQNTGVPVSWYEYALKVCEIKGVDCAFTPISTAEYRTLHPEVAERPLNSVFEDYDMPNWEDSLKEYIDAYC